MPGGYKPTSVRGIYTSGKAFFERVCIVVSGTKRDSFKKLPATKLKEAENWRNLRRAEHYKAEEGLVAIASPYEKPAPSANAAKATMHELCQAFIDAGCPDRDRQFKTGFQLKEEKRRAELLRGWDGWGVIPEMNNATFLRYEAYRRARNGSRIKNARTIDQEVITLKNVLRWAVLTEKLKAFPFANVEVIRFQKGEAEHAKQHCCASTDELHTIAARLFDYPRCEVLGFQMLLEAFTGMRTSEALRLRWDAKYGEPGYIDGDYLHIGRAKDGVNPWVFIHPALRALLKAMEKWRAVRVVELDSKVKFPLTNSPWFFPSPINPEKPVDICPLRYGTLTSQGKVSSNALTQSKTQRNAPRFTRCMKRNCWGKPDKPKL